MTHKIDIQAGEYLVATFAGCAEPVLTAAANTVAWLNETMGVRARHASECSVDSGAPIIIGTLADTPVRELVQRHELPDSVRHDGYVLAALPGAILIYAAMPRGVVFACGYELPRWLQVADGAFICASERVVEEPGDDVRALSSFMQDFNFIPEAAERFRINTVHLGTPLLPEHSLPPEARDIRLYTPGEWTTTDSSPAEKRRNNEHGIALAKARGLDVIIGGNGLFFLPMYLRHIAPETIARGLWSDSGWPPYEWQDTSKTCLSQPRVWEWMRAFLDELMVVHPAADGFWTCMGYDGFPFGCGCAQCRGYSYHDRLRDLAQLCHDVVVGRHGKKLWIFTWIVGGNSAIPGYDHFYGWSREFAEADPEHVFMTSYATAGDFNPPHPLNPVIGARGPNDFANILLWPDYMGDGILPAWHLNWMAEAMPAYRRQGARGFLLTDTDPVWRYRDSVQRADHYAAAEWMWTHDKPAETIAREYCEQTFGAAAAPALADALPRTLEAATAALFTPDGIRFSGHGNLEEDLRLGWEVYTLYDSAPFHLSPEQCRQITEAGPPYFEQIENAFPCLAATEEVITRNLAHKDGGLETLNVIRESVETVREHLRAEDYQHLRERLDWATNYTQVCRGYVEGVLRLRRGGPEDADGVRHGADLMEQAFARLPHDPPPLRHGLHAWFDGYPWMVTSIPGIVDDLRAAADLLASDLRCRPIGLMGCEDVATDLESMFLPFERIHDFAGDFRRFGVVAVGSAFLPLLDEKGSALADYVEQGGAVLVHHVSGNARIIPSEWLPGCVQAVPCNHDSVSVWQSDHPVLTGMDVVASRPIVRFRATSSEKNKRISSRPMLLNSLGVTQEWTALTQPIVLAEALWGAGRVFLNTVPQNRTILLRILAYLAGEE